MVADLFNNFLNLQALNNIAIRDNQSCTLRVCELILNLLELLIDMGVLKRCLRDESLENQGNNYSRIKNIQNFIVSLKKIHDSLNLYFTDSFEKSESGDKNHDSPVGYYQNGEIKITSHNYATNCIIRILRHLGCPHGCTDGIRGPQADFCRSQVQTLLNRLHKASAKQFSFYLRRYVKERPMFEVVEFLHSYTGFCVDPTSLLSPLSKYGRHLCFLSLLTKYHNKSKKLMLLNYFYVDQKRGSNKSPDSVPQGSYATNFGAGLMGGISNSNTMPGSGNIHNVGGPGTSSAFSGIGGHRFRNIESQIMGCVFKTLVTRCVELSKDLKSQENISLYCDLRQFMTFVKEAHGGIFRRVALSSILDSADRPGKKPKSEIQTTRVIRYG